MNIILCIGNDDGIYFVYYIWYLSALNDHNGHHVFKTRHTNEIHVNFLHSHVTTIGLKENVKIFYESQPTLSEYFSPCAQQYNVIINV